MYMYITVYEEKEVRSDVSESSTLLIVRFKFKEKTIILMYVMKSEQVIRYVCSSNLQWIILFI